MGVIALARSHGGNAANRGTLHVGSNPKQDSHLTRKQNTVGRDTYLPRRAPLC